MGKSFKDIFKSYVEKNENLFKNKTVVDFPAGSGVISQFLNEKNWGIKVLAFDLFPEFFKYPGLKCEKADAMQGLPLEKNSVDLILCQEGIEHFSDQLKSLKNFSQVLKMGGTLIVTTPNYSSLTAKMSYLLSESERFNRHMPPNEIDSIWLNQNTKDNEVYLGHIFLLGIQKLRLIGKLSGFKIKNVYFSEFKLSSFLWLLIFYPFIILSNTISYLKNIRKNPTAKKVYKEVFCLAINPKILVDGSLVVEFEKECEHDQITQHLRKIGNFDLQT